LTATRLNSCSSQDLLFSVNLTLIYTVSM